jgi:two-component system OmpR family response regulator
MKRMFNTAAPLRFELAQAYAVTPRGQQELAGAACTTLSSAQLELLVRMDGTLALGEIMRSMPGLSEEDFARAFHALRDRELVSAVEDDPFRSEMQTQLEAFSESVGAEVADAAALSLRRTGYYVGIARKPAKAPQRAAGQPLQAVVVEDEPVLARFVQSYLAFEGIQVRLAANRAEVSGQLGTRPIPDLVLLDVALPDADGFDILARIRRHRHLQEVPVIMLTGTTTREAVIRGMRLGADGYVTKPFDAETLMRVVRTALGLPGAARSSDPWVNPDAKARRGPAG